jgi:hypothetical protein
MTHSRLIRGSVIAAIFIAATTFAQTSHAATGDDATQQCYDAASGVPFFGDKACRTVHQFVKGTGRTCRAALPAEECVTADGRYISPKLVDEYESSWVPGTLALQRGLDDAEPMYRELWVHTHNSFNAEAYDPTFSGLDPNQIYSITDQLRMGIRAIEIDVHWAPSAEGNPADGGNAPIVCHGEPVGLPPEQTGQDPVAFAHVGCTTEVHLKTRLQEVANWLADDPNQNEVLLIYLENNMDGNETAHVRASEAIQEKLGDLIYRPSSGGATCESLPIDLSRRDIRESGKRVLLTGNCGPGGWHGFVFDRGPRWDESSSPAGTQYPAYPDCLEGGAPANYTGQTWARFFEDSTWLSAMVTGTGLGSTGEITAEEAQAMVRCGVNMPGFDQLQPFDPRLEALVWSWAQDEPRLNADGSCAFSGPNGFGSDSCGSSRQFACATADGGWVISRHSGPWSKGEDRCGKVGGTFSVPKNGYESERLNEARGTKEVWLDYRYDSSQSGWTPEVGSSKTGPPRWPVLGTRRAVG